jgi:hypothetical protein
MKKRAYLPTVDVLDDRLRVYFSSMDDNMIGRIGYADLDKKDPRNVLNVSKEPVLDIGSAGMFDEHGVTPSCVVTIGFMKRLYYYGWMKTTEAPQIIFTGLALADVEYQEDYFVKYSNVPILDREVDEYTNRAALFVMPELTGYFAGRFSGWYTGSITGFCKTFQDKKVPYYTIKHIVSDDGIHWKRDYSDLTLNGNEFGLARPCVIQDGYLDYKMWYSIRSFDEPYKMGYATSLDGMTWKRMDKEVGIERSNSGWDSEMICFPYVIDVDGRRLMFYNGNSHGESGFGYAELS